MPKTTPLERSIENYGAQECKKLGYIVLKLSLLGGRGWPDHTIFAPGGKVGFMEYKREGGSFQPLQEYWLRKLSEFGFYTRVCVAKKDVDNFLEEFGS